MEAELVAFESVTTEAKWLKELLMDLTMVTKSVLIILLQCDNQRVITIVDNVTTCETTNQISKIFEKYWRDCHKVY
jgi:hypothetical protein